MEMQTALDKETQRDVVVVVWLEQGAGFFGEVFLPLALRVDRQEWLQH